MTYECVKCRHTFQQSCKLQVHIKRHRISPFMVVSYNYEHAFSQTLETTHTSVSTVERVSKIIVTYKRTLGYIQEKSHTSVSTVERVSIRVVIYKHTLGYIQETSHTSVSTVKRLSINKVAYKHTFGFILETNHSSVSIVNYQIIELYFQFFFLSITIETM